MTFFINFADVKISLTLCKIPWQFPDLEKFNFSLTFPWRLWTLPRAYAWCWRTEASGTVEDETSTLTVPRPQPCATHGTRLTDCATEGQSLPGEPPPGTLQCRPAVVDPLFWGSLLSVRGPRPRRPPAPLPLCRCCCWGLWCWGCRRRCCWRPVWLVDWFTDLLPVPPEPTARNPVVPARLHKLKDWLVVADAGLRKLADKPPCSSCWSLEFLQFCMKLLRGWTHEMVAHERCSASPCCILLCQLEMVQYNISAYKL